MISPRDRKLVELKRKLSSLKLEFAEWQTASKDEHSTLPKHHSQIVRVTTQLESFATSIEGWLGELQHDEARLQAEARQLEAVVLDVHRIWEFFRAKLSQRYVDWLRPYLVAADEFAWACYNAAREASDPAVVPAARVREPPLVFLNGGWSPFTVPRGRRYEAEEVPGEDITVAEFQQVLQDLPIPVIGVPWSQVRHLPDAVTIGHEVGHDVEHDFGLTSILRVLLHQALDARGVGEARQAGWRAWLSELFADLYGVLATGPAYVGGLMDSLAFAPDDVMTDRQPKPKWLSHPPHALRMSFNFAALRTIGCPEQAASLSSAWSSRFPRHVMEEFEDDIEPIVIALRDGPYRQFKNRPLTAVLSFGRTEHAQAKSVKESLWHNVESAQPVRALIAGARLAFETSPVDFTASNSDRLVLDVIQKAQTAAVRRADEAHQLNSQDVAAGRALFERFRKFRS